MNYIVSYPYSASFYIFLLMLSVLCALIAQSLNKKVSSGFMVVIVILVLSIPAGFRHSIVGKDTWGYIRAIESLNPAYLGELFYSHFEFGFQFIIRSLVYIVKEPNYVLFIISLLTNILIISTLWFLREKMSFVVAVFCYFTMYYFETYNIARQWLAIAIVFFAFRYLIKSRYGLFIIFTIIACSIHKSAFICFSFIPVHMLMVKKVHFKYKVLIILSVILILFFPNQILTFTGLASIIEKYQYYYIYGKAYKNVDFGFYFILRLAIILFALFLFKKKDYKFSDTIFQKQIIVMCLLGTVMTMSGYIYKFAGRIGTYASIYEIVLFSMISKTKTFSVIIKIVIVLLGLLLLYLSLSSSSQGQMPYRLFGKY